MRFTLLLVFATTVSSSSHITACSCYGLNYFCDAVAFSLQYGPDRVLVARGRKIESIKVNEHQDDMIFIIEESFINPKNLKIVRIRDGNGALCTRAVSHYSKTEELIIHAYLSEDAETDEITAELSSCEPEPLTVKNGKVRGTIAAGINVISLAGFREMSDCSISTFQFNPHYTLDFLLRTKSAANTGIPLTSAGHFSILTMGVSHVCESKSTWSTRLYCIFGSHYKTQCIIRV